MAVRRVVFMGSPEFAVPALAALLAAPTQVAVVAAYTQPDRPAGRGRRLQPAPVKAHALAAGVPCLAPTRMRAPETAAELAALRPDLVVVAAYGRILPSALLAVPPLGCVNLHASLLPRHRGASPVAHALLAGDAESGVCLMQMDAGLDTGPVLAERRLAIDAADTAGTLTARLATLGAGLLADALPALLAGRLEAVPQPQAGVTYAPLLHKSMGSLDFTRDAGHLARQVRAMQPWPGSTLTAANTRVVVLAARASAAAAAAGTAPGTVTAADARGVAVACGTGTLWIERVRPAGRRDMAAAAWVAGRGVNCGTVLRGTAPEEER